MFIESVWVQPVLTENGTLGGTSCAVSGTQYSADFACYKAFDDNTTTSQWVSGNGLSLPQDLIFYTPTAIKPSKFTFQNSSITEGPNSPKVFEIFVSNNNSDWTSLGTFTNSVNTSDGALWSKEVTCDNFYKYIKFHVTQTNYAENNLVCFRNISITATYVPS